MSETAATSAVKTAGTPAQPAQAAIASIFLEFLVIGSTSFGGVVPYLRNSLVTKMGWVNDKEFVEKLSISQSLPGLNATNMAILVGDKLRGVPGAIAAIVGVCLPGAVLMYVIGMFYRHHVDRPWAVAGLKGVAAAAIGLILFTVVQLSETSLSARFDFVFMALTVICIHYFHLGVPRTLIGVGILAILFHHPRRQKASAAP